MNIVYVLNAPYIGQSVHETLRSALIYFEDRKMINPHVIDTYEVPKSE